MKHALVIIALLFSFAAHAQQQEGQTCLFQCLHYIHPEKPVDTIIQDFKHFTGTNQDVYQDGAKATVQTTIDFIATQVDTIDVKKIGVIQALEDHYRLLTVMHLTDDNGNVYDHEIVLTGLKAKNDDYSNPEKVKLLFYNPATGRIQAVSMADYVASNPHYCIAVKA